MLLPLHPQPKPDEILSSWMVRLAFANGFPLHTFYANLLGYRAPIWNRDTDRHTSMALLSLLGRYTGQPLSALHALTLDAYEGVLFEQLPTIGIAPWILPVGVLHRLRRRAGMQFCPLCLLSDAIPYYRRSWRLALHPVCVQHRCVMQEYCPSCHEPVAYHRHGVGRGKKISDQALQCCHLCGCDLRCAQPAYVDWPDPLSWQSLSKMICSFEQGGWNCGPLTPPCGVPFFSGLRVLVGVVNGRHGMRLRERLSDILGVSFDNRDPAHHMEFELLGASERSKLLLATSWLLADWPCRFVSMCAECAFTRSRLAEDVRGLPFWLASVADEYLDRRLYLPNASEVVAAGNYLRCCGENVTPRTLGLALGLPRDSAKAAWRYWRDLVIDQ